MVLFENLETDPYKRSAMVGKLIMKIDELRDFNKGKCYNNQIFRMVREEQERVAKKLKIDLAAVAKDEKEVALIIQKKSALKVSEEKAGIQVNEEYAKKKAEIQKLLHAVEDDAQESIIKRIRKELGCTIL